MIELGMTDMIIDEAFTNAWVKDNHFLSAMIDIRNLIKMKTSY